MDPVYESVVDPASLMTSGIPLILHTVAFVMEVGLASYLGIQGLLLLRSGAGAVGEAAEGWGFVSVPAHRRVLAGAGSLGVGLALLAPVATGAPDAVGRLSLIVAIGLVLGLRRQATRRSVLRGLALASVVLVAVLSVYEGRDPAKQLRDVATKATDWRQHELDWQLDNDRRSPKVGDLAPDFELGDTTGENSVRLATFRGDRPVALVFGSYT